MSAPADDRADSVAAVLSGSRDDALLREVSRRVLWLSAAIVDAANAGRPNDSGVKAGGHQASSASMVDIMVALWFAGLTRLDRVSVKPHASPVLHAVNYLLGDLDEAYLPTLRAKGGLQSYPSRLKDPDTVDFSTGSVGIGATAALWAAVSHRYVASQFTSTPPAGRFISLLGDAELDEGAIWEAVVDPQVAQLGELLWVVDLNRQSLDRVVPDIAIQRLQGMFAAAGLIAFLALILLLISAAYGLVAVGLAPWLAFLIVAGTLLLIGAILVFAVINLRIAPDGTLSDLGVDPHHGQDGGCFDHAGQSANVSVALANTAISRTPASRARSSPSRSVSGHAGSA